MWLLVVFYFQHTDMMFKIYFGRSKTGICSVAFWQTYTYRQPTGGKDILKLIHGDNQEVSNVIKYMKDEFFIYFSEKKCSSLLDCEPTFKVVLQLLRLENMQRMTTKMAKGQSVFFMKKMKNSSLWRGKGWEWGGLQNQDDR